MVNLKLVDIPRPHAEDQPSPRACVHCGLPVPRDRREFCCDGCEAVNRILVGEGLQRYYDLQQVPSAPPIEASEDGLAWVERLLGAERVPSTGSALRSIDLDVQGVHCAACVWLLEELFFRSPGACDIRINPMRGTVRLAWRDGEFDLARYVREAAAVGYRLAPPGSAVERSTRATGMKLGVSIAMAMNVMVLSATYYFGLSPADGPVYDVVGLLSAALATVALLVGGGVFVRAAWSGLRRRIIRLDLPIAVGIVLAFAGSTWAWLAKGPEGAYYDSVTAFIALMLVGEWLRERILDRNRRMLHGGLEALDTRRRRGERLEAIAARDIEPGDELWISPGDIVPVRGRVRSDGGEIALDWITGEVRPVSIVGGAELRAGARNVGASTLRVVAAEPFTESDVRKLVDDTPLETDGVRRSTTSNRLGLWWVIGVFAVSALGFGLWIPQGLERALTVVVSLLVVTCPCALGLAMPLSRELTLLALRGAGTFVHDDDLLTRVQGLRHVVFDKTGTLTHASLALDGTSAAALAALDPALRDILTQLVARSRHPVCAAVHRALDGAVVTGVSGADEIREEVGRGMVWRRGDGVYRFGRPADGSPGTVLERDGHVLLHIHTEERLYGDAKVELDRLRERGLGIHVASGDRTDRVARVGRSLDVASARAAVSPLEKAEFVRELGAASTMFVGDGLNDLPALRVAACAGTPALHRPGLALRVHFSYLGEGVGAVRRVLAGADHVARAFRFNIAFAVAYNAGAVALCLAGLITPVVAAILMPVSSAALVLVTTARAKRLEASWKS